jgi:DNA repair protein RecN (Recombination protein N)
MIKHLILNNLVLVETCEIHFAPSFNVVTGETGAGKTAFIEAISLALGARADSSLIRKGCDHAYIEIAFDIENVMSVKDLLNEAGISLDAEEYLVIRREISKEGKNRAFINCRMAPLPLLQKIGTELIDLIGQHAHQYLRTTDAQRNLVDLFGSLQEDLKTFQSCYAKEKQLKKKLEELEQLSSQRAREEDTWRYQLDEIETANIKQGEEESLFEKYQRLANSQELTDKIQLIIKNLSESPSAILPQLARFHKICDSLVTYDRNLSETTSLIHEAQIALTEALRSLQSCNDGLESDPNAFQFLENRLNAISRIKRKYGQTFEEIEAFSQKLKAELNRLENLSDEIATANSDLLQAQAEVDKASQILTKKRKETALRLQQILTDQLQMLNMAGAEISIEMSSQERNHFGDDLLQFWLKANTGEHPGLVKEHSSGGELSRLLFAIKIALAEKNNTPTLIFDEIDANVGGKTASIIGEKLKELGKYRQVICITHFPQVASKADEHFGVQKLEVQGRTLTEIKLLSKKQREQELLRMIGGKQLNLYQT